MYVGAIDMQAVGRKKYIQTDDMTERKNCKFSNQTQRRHSKNKEKKICIQNCSCLFFVHVTGSAGNLMLIEFHCIYYK